MNQIVIAVLASGVSAFFAACLGVYVAVDRLGWRTGQLEASTGDLWTKVSNVRERVAALEARTHN